MRIIARVVGIPVVLLGLTGSALADPPFDQVIVNPDGSRRSIGIQRALCHSTVADSFSPGIGHRLDGWANRDANVGAIVALAPDLAPAAGLLGVHSGTSSSTTTACSISVSPRRKYRTWCST